MRMFEDTVAAALGHCPPGTVCLASVSGGADSTAMLAALAALVERGAAFQLRCIHVEHGIRPPGESRGDAAFVRALCGKFRVPCRVVSVKPGKIAEVAKERGMGIEAAARHYRRRAWRGELRRVTAETGLPARLLTAHTADDLLETVLMRVLRGAGPAGLAAMPAEKGRILRPLLALSRADVLQYLADKKLSWREDATNADIRYFRNRVRHRLIPLLNELFPQWRGAVGSLAETQSLCAAFIREEAARRVEWRPDGINRAQGLFPACTAMRADAELFFAQPAIVREEALFQGMDRLLAAGNGPPREIRRANIRRFAGGGLDSLDCGPLYLRREAGGVLIEAKRPDAAEYGFSLLIKAPGSYNLTGVCPEDGTEAADEFAALLPLVLRPSFKDDIIEKRGRKTSPPDLQVPGPLITAVDSLGPAAFIGPAGLLLCREDTAVPADDRKRCTVAHGSVHVR